MGSTRLESLIDFARKGIALRVRCRKCGKVAIIPSDPLLTRMLRRGQPLNIKDLSHKMRCVGCGAKDADISA